jgi:hypothetical protein
VEILPYSQYHIDTIVTESGGEPWCLTCVYGEAQVPKHHKTWDMLKFISATLPLPWMCIGDFNEVLLRSEHQGAQEQSWS